MLLFSLMVLAHLLGDFVFQTDQIAKNKMNPPVKTEARTHKGVIKSEGYKLHISKGLLLHVSHHTVLALLAVLILAVLTHHFAWKVLWIPVITAVSHLIIDAAKMIVMESHRRPVAQIPQTSGIPHSKLRLSPLFLFFIDQCLHLAVTFLLVRFYSDVDFQALMASFRTFIEGQSVHLHPTQRIVSLMIVTICATTVSSTIVQMIATPPQMDAKSESSTTRPRDENALELDGKSHSSSLMQPISIPISARDETAYTYDALRRGQAYTVRRGKMIGYLERLILVIIISIGAYTAITFIVAAKSLIRLKRFDEPAFAEYFLVGTLTSMFCGTLCGLLLKHLLV